MYLQKLTNFFIKVTLLRSDFRKISLMSLRVTQGHLSRKTSNYDFSQNKWNNSSKWCLRIAQEKVWASDSEVNSGLQKLSKCVKRSNFYCYWKQVNYIRIWHFWRQNFKKMASRSSLVTRGHWKLFEVKNIKKLKNWSVFEKIWAFMNVS